MMLAHDTTIWGASTLPPPDQAPELHDCDGYEPESAGLTPAQRDALAAVDAEFCVSRREAAVGALILVATIAASALLPWGFA